MGFWNLSDNDDATKTGTEYEVPGGNMEPIPADSSVLAMPEAAKWSTKQGKEERFVEITWTVLAPAEYKNRKVFHKLWVDDLDPSAKSEEKAIAKKDKAIRMLAAIDANAGGKLMKSGEAPTDDSLALALCNKTMVIKLMVWDFQTNDGQRMVGNWIAAVAPKNAELSIGDQAPPKASGSSAPASGGGYGGGGGALGDDIPF